MKKTALLALLMLTPLTATAEIHKCIIDGHTTFQDFPCSQGAVRLTDNGTLSTLPATPPLARSPAPTNSSPAQQPQRRSYNTRNNSYQSFTERRNAEITSSMRPNRGAPQSHVYDTYGRPHTRSTVMRNGKACDRLVWKNSFSNSEKYIAIICDEKVYSFYGPYR